jgi:hypothetical protein
MAAADPRSRRASSRGSRRGARSPRSRSSSSSARTGTRGARTGRARADSRGSPATRPVRAPNPRVSDSVPLSRAWAAKPCAPGMRAAAEARDHDQVRARRSDRIATLRNHSRIRRFTRLRTTALPDLAARRHPRPAGQPPRRGHEQHEAPRKWRRPVARSSETPANAGSAPLEGTVRSAGSPCFDGVDGVSRFRPWLGGA